MEIRVTLDSSSDAKEVLWTAAVLHRPDLRAIGATAEEAVARLMERLNAPSPPKPVELVYETPMALQPAAAKESMALRYAGRGLVNRLPEVEPADSAQMGLYYFIWGIILVFAGVIVLVGLVLLSRAR